MNSPGRRTTQENQEEGVIIWVLFALSIIRRTFKCRTEKQLVLATIIKR